MSYCPNWERALLLTGVSSIAAIGSWILHDTLGPTVITTALALLSFFLWLLVVGISITHSASSLRIEGEEILQTHFSFVGRRVPLSNLREVEVIPGFFPVVLRFQNGDDMCVSSMTSDRLLTFIREVRWGWNAGDIYAHRFWRIRLCRP